MRTIYRRFCTGLILLLWILAGTTSKAQVDTIAVNETSFVSLLMPEQVTQVTLGNDGYDFSISGKAIYFKATRKRPSPTNMAIEYGDGQHFLVYVEYVAACKRFSYDFRSLHALDELASRYPQHTIRQESSYDIPSLKRFLLSLSAKKGTDPISSKRIDDITLSLWYICNDQDRLTYLYLTVSNKSTLPYPILATYVRYRSKSRGRGLGDQISRVTPAVISAPEIVDPHHQEMIGVALPHKGKRKNARLEIIVKEKEGDRSIILSIRHSHISSAPLVTTYHSK